MTKSLKDFANDISEALLEGVTPPPADTFDEVAFPYGKAAGANKFGMTKCPTCGKPPTEHKGGQYFLFADEGSAREYYISGMCQACQDGVFK